MVILVKETYKNNTFEHRVFIEDKTFYGVENLFPRMDNNSEWETFLTLTKSLPSGEFKNLSWIRE
jgi:hypothetical protein